MRKLTICIDNASPLRGLALVNLYFQFFQQSHTGYPGFSPERMGGIKSEPGSNPRHPTPSTSTGRTSVPTLKAIQTQIQHLSKLLYQQISKTSSNTEMTTPERTKVKKEEPKEEPEDPTPEKEPVSDTDECIQNLQDHLASTQMATESPNPQAPKRTKHPPPNRTLKTNTKKGRMLRMNLTLGARSSRK